MLMLGFKVKNGVKRSSYFRKFLLKRIPKIGLISSRMGLKQAVPKIKDSS